MDWKMSLTNEVIPTPTKALFCVTGLTPQIVTETLYGLCVAQQPAWVPDRVVVVTTVEGKKRILEQLLNKSGGCFDAFCADYGLTGRMVFDASCVIVPVDKAGQPLDDVRTEADNVCMGDAILSCIHGLVGQFDALHVSIAGGRKTMGYYAGTALSMYGRAQDRMSHVLVNEPFEQAPTFYFPPAVPVMVVLRNGATLSSAMAQVGLADMPFLRLGGLTAPSLQVKPLSFESLVAQVQSVLPPPIRLALDMAGFTVNTGAGKVKLEPAQFLTFAWYAMIKQRGLGQRGRMLDSDELFDTHYQDFMTAFSPSGALNKRSQKRLKTEAGNLQFRIDSTSQALSKVRKRFKQAFGAAAAHYDVKTVKGRGRSLVTDAAQIVLPPEMLRYDLSPSALRHKRQG
jgi:CRISPR-associated protein (TIGR02584 family)